MLKPSFVKRGNVRAEYVEQYLSSGERLSHVTACALGAYLFVIIGCSSKDWRKNEVFAVPLQPSLQQEVILARMEQILASRSLTDDEYAQLLYERGVLYDSLGLRALARNDFSTALAIRPDIPEVFNF